MIQDQDVWFNVFALTWFSVTWLILKIPKRRFRLNWNVLFKRTKSEHKCSCTNYNLPLVFQNVSQQGFSMADLRLYSLKFRNSKISKNYCMSLFGIKNELENSIFILTLLGVSEKFSKQILIFMLGFLPLKIEISKKNSYWIRYKILSLDLQSFNILDIWVKSNDSCSIFRIFKISEN